MKYILLFLLSTSLYAGRMGWSFAMFSKNVDGSLRFKRTHYTLDGCQAHKNIFYADRADIICLKIK
jgi:hypothetical protein